MILLASGSPRRAELLRLIGAEFEVQSVDLDETPLIDERPADYVERLALQKAQTGWDRFAIGGNYQAALGADTSVVLAGDILGKPKDAEDYREMMLALSGQLHEVISAVALTNGVDSQVSVVVSQVKIRPMSLAEIEAYWITGEPLDKAGGYAIQGLGSVFVESVNGSYSAVVGLPLKETAELLTQFNVDYWLTGSLNE